MCVEHRAAGRKGVRTPSRSSSGRPWKTTTPYPNPNQPTYPDPLAVETESEVGAPRRFFMALCDPKWPHVPGDVHVRGVLWKEVWGGRDVGELCQGDGKGREDRGGWSGLRPPRHNYVQGVGRPWVPQRHGRVSGPVAVTGERKPRWVQGCAEAQLKMIWRAASKGHPNQVFFFGGGGGGRFVDRGRQTDHTPGHSLPKGPFSLRLRFFRRSFWPHTRPFSLLASPPPFFVGEPLLIRATPCALAP